MGVHTLLLSKPSRLVALVTLLLALPVTILHGIVHRVHLQQVFVLFGLLVRIQLDRAHVPTVGPKLLGHFEETATFVLVEHETSLVIPLTIILAGLYQGILLFQICFILRELIFVRGRILIDIDIPLINVADYGRLRIPLLRKGYFEVLILELENCAF